MYAEQVDSISLTQDTGSETVINNTLRITRFPWMVGYLGYLIGYCQDTLVHICLRQDGLAKGHSLAHGAACSVGLPGYTQLEIIDRWRSIASESPQLNSIDLASLTSVYYWGSERLCKKGYWYPEFDLGPSFYSPLDSEFFKGNKESLDPLYKMRPRYVVFPLASSRSNLLTGFNIVIASLCIPGYARAACTDSACEPAGGWDDFANNLGSDLAPLLALFGEQVTKQYMSETLSWIDNVIFCLAPLGIITAIVSTIRVGGSPKLRSLVGRAKESRGQVEADLMSSTSSDVCELWNGEGVVRVLGRPVLLQLVYEKSSEGGSGPGGGSRSKISTFEEAIFKNLYKEEGEETQDPIQSDTSLDPEIEGYRKRQNPPNLSLNISMVPLSKRVLVVFVVIGVILQGGVLVYSAATQYVLKFKKNDAPPIGYGFPLFLAATILLAIGMFLCAQVVELSTKEKIWVRTEPTGAIDIIWLQQGGQTVGDQRFESFARKTSGKKIITSHKIEERKILSFLVTVGVGATLVGFIAQFVAMRAMHSSVTAAQLGAILVMTAIRSCAHIQRESKNDIKEPDNVEGHELDWLAKDLKGCKTWMVISGPESPIPPQSNPPSTLAMEVMDIRTSLAELSKNWVLEDRVQVRNLENAIEESMNTIYLNMALLDKYKDISSFEWILRARVEVEKGLPERSEVKITIEREKDQNNKWKPWRVKGGVLEAVLCLWISSLTEEARERSRDGSGRRSNIRCLSLAPLEARIDYNIWTNRGAILVPKQRLLDETRYFGRVSGEEDIWCVDTGSDLKTLCVQELYAAFMFAVVQVIKEVGGKTGQRTITAQPSETDADVEGDLWNKCGLTNTNVDLLASGFHESHLGSIEEAYMIIIPALRAVKKLMSVHDAYGQLRSVVIFLEMAVPDRPAIVTRVDLGRLRRTTRLLRASFNEESTEEWNSTLIEFRDDMDHTFVRSKGLVNLCICQKKLNPTMDFNEIFQVAFTALKGWNIDQKPRFWIALEFAWFALHEGKEEEAGELARQIWDQNISARDTISSKLRLEAAQIVMIVRRKNGTFMHKNELNSYLQGHNPELHPDQIRRKTHSTDSLKDDQVPLDLMLIDQWRTPIQAAAGSGNSELVELLLSLNADVNAKSINAYLDLGGQDKSSNTLGGIVNDIRGRSCDELNGGLVRVSKRVQKFSGVTALQAAAKEGHLETVNLLLNRKGGVNAPAGRYGRTALQAAAEGGHLDIVERLLQEKADVNAAAAYSSGRTALQGAAEGGHLDIVERLLQEKADVNAAAAYSSGRTALQAAAEGGHLDIVERLLQEKADVNAAVAGDSGRTALQAAAEGGHLDIVERLLQEKADVNAAAVRHRGRTALQAAAEGGHLDIVERLLQEKADVNAAAADYSSGRTALQAAAEGGHLDIVERLLQEKADVNAAAAERSGRTALQAAAEGGHLDIVERLLQEKADVNAAAAERSGRTALQAAAEGGHLDIVERLLQEKADVNAAAAERSGRTALQAAAEGGHLDIVERLLQEKADVNAAAAGVSGRTALQAAAEGGHLDIVERLLQEKAYVNAAAAEWSGRTALQAAAEGGHLDIVERLLQEKADVNAAAAGVSGRTALQAAAEGGHLDIVERLLQEKADVNAAAADYSSGRTALQAAAEGGHLDIVERLLQEKADVNAAAAGVSGRTALQAAAEGGHLDIVERLLQEKADVNAAAAERSGRTALEAATRKGHKRIVELLEKEIERIRTQKEEKEEANQIPQPQDS
ncbi:ankyrin repeat-containing domain protein [Morchella snyderi]|nr:ankyrin repeat-containing domain protein [Morchella snyderi]